MKICRLSAGALAAALMLAAPMTSVYAAYRSDAEQAITAAKAARDKAAAAGAATADTAAIIKEAEELLASRQYTKAIELATKAKKQDEYALSQAGAAKAPAAGASAETGKKTEAERAIADAEAARKKADSVGGEWRDTAKMIKDAQDLVKSGDFEGAIKLANRAKRQGELGYDQAISQKGATFPSYVLQKQ
jgi:hypothetical protein